MRPASPSTGSASTPASEENGDRGPSGIDSCIIIRCLLLLLLLLLLLVVVIVGFLRARPRGQPRPQPFVYMFASVCEFVCFVVLFSLVSVFIDFGPPRPQPFVYMCLFMFVVYVKVVCELVWLC